MLAVLIASTFFSTAVWAQMMSEAQLFDCCACKSFSTKVAGKLASADDQQLNTVVKIAREVWWHQTTVAGWLEAFGAHPRIGNAAALRAKFGSFANMSREEQSAAAGASEDVYQGLEDWNSRYEAKFGHVFLISAAGKNAQTILDSLQARCESPPHEELLVAATQQMHITERRLASYFNRSSDPLSNPTQEGSSEHLTSHFLDTSLGRPAEGVLITVQRSSPGSAGPTSLGVWETIGAKRTNSDGRVPGILPSSNTLPAGQYRVVFGTEEYMATVRKTHPGVWPAVPFYPSAAVVFNRAPDQISEHFHVPLTWNPYGYSTYKGS